MAFKNTQYRNKRWFLYILKESECGHSHLPYPHSRGWARRTSESLMPTRPSCETLSQKQKGKGWGLRRIQTKPERIHRCVSIRQRACTSVWAKIRGHAQICACTRGCAHVSPHERACMGVWADTRGCAWVCGQTPEGVHGCVSRHQRECMGVWAHTRGCAWVCEHIHQRECMGV